jgi:hypothetical protein
MFQIFYNETNKLVGAHLYRSLSATLRQHGSLQSKISAQTLRVCREGKPYGLCAHAGLGVRIML